MHSPPRHGFMEAPLFPDLHETLLQLLREASRADPLSDLVLVVPNKRILRHLVRGVLRHEGGTLRLRGMTLLELALQVTANERWRQGRELLPQPGAAFLSRRALARDKRPPGFFAEALDLRGFRNAMASCFDEIAAAGLAAPEDLERFIVRHGEMLNRRTRHALEMTLGYRRALESRHDDAWSVLRQAARVEPEAAATALGTNKLWLHGFETLHLFERRLVQRILPAMQLFVTCVPPTPGNEGLSSWLRSLGFSPLAPTAIASPPTRSPTVQALSAPGDEVEAREIARRVLQATAAGVPFEEMAVVTRNVAGLPLLEETLRGLGVPCTAPALFSLASRRAGRALLLWLELAESGLAPAPVFEFLLLVPARWSDWCGIDADPVPSAWERVGREARLGTGLEDWRVKLRRQNEAWRQRLQRQGEGASRAGTAAAAARDELIRVAEVLTRDLQVFPARARWSEYVAVTEDFVRRAFHDDPETLLLLAAVGRLRGLDSLPGPRPTRTDFRETLRMALGRERGPAPESREGGVTLATAEEIRGCDFEWVCLAGLQEGDWPGPVPEDPVLPDRDRAVLNRLLQDPTALPLRSHHIEKQRRLFGTLAAAARGHLLLSFARLDATTAAARLPSALLLEFAERREGRPLGYEELGSLDWCERVPLRRRDVPATGPVLSEEEFDALTVAQLPRGAARRYVRKLGVPAARGLALETLRNGRPRFTAFDGLLADPEALRGLQAEVDARPFSASQLSTYATCPFRYFMRHLLRVEPLDRRERREPTVLEVGLLVHGILESFYDELTREGVDLSRADPSDCQARLRRAAEAGFLALETSGAQGAPLLWEIRKQSLREDLGRFLRQELQRLAAGAAWVPAQFEVRFGPEAGSSPAVSHAGSVIRFRGVIDRVDHHPEHDGVCVVDYKSGRALAGKRNPQVIQLVLYLLAACRSDPERLQRSEARFLYVTRRGGFVTQRLPGARVAMRRDDFDAFVRGIRSGIEAGELFPQPGPHAMHCAFCDYRGLCDVRIARQVEQKGGSGQDARWRELPDFSGDLEPVAGSTDGEEID